MTTHAQLKLFGEQCWGENQPLFWQVLVRDEHDIATAQALEYIEGYTGKLPANTVLIPLQVLFVPGTNFFLMPLLEDGDDKAGN